MAGIFEIQTFFGDIAFPLSSVLDRICWGGEEKKKGGQVSGWTDRASVQNFGVYLFKTAWTFGLLRGEYVKLA